MPLSREDVDLKFSEETTSVVETKWWRFVDVYFHDLRIGVLTARGDHRPYEFFQKSKLGLSMKEFYTKTPLLTVAKYRVIYAFKTSIWGL